jgi:hypothetical protein
LDLHLQHKSLEAHMLLDQQLASEPKGVDGLPKDPQALRSPRRGSWGRCLVQRLGLGHAARCRVVEWTGERSSLRPWTKSTIRWSCSHSTDIFDGVDGAFCRLLDSGDLPGNILQAPQTYPESENGGHLSLFPRLSMQHAPFPRRQGWRGSQVTVMGTLKCAQCCHCGPAIEGAPLMNLGPHAKPYQH